MTQMPVQRFELPAAQFDYRCGGCGRVWSRRGTFTAESSTGEWRFRATVQGWFRCCAGKDGPREFGWDMPSNANEQAPAPAPEQGEEAG